MDISTDLKFLSGQENKIYHDSLKDHPKISNTATFCCEMCAYNVRKFAYICTDVRKTLPLSRQLILTKK